jgi:hypothetical protein
MNKFVQLLVTPHEYSSEASDFFWIAVPISSIKQITDNNEDDPENLVQTMLILDTGVYYSSIDINEYVMNINNILE